MNQEIRVRADGPYVVLTFGRMARVHDMPYSVALAVWDQIKMHVRLAALAPPDPTRILPAGKTGIEWAYDRAALVLPARADHLSLPWQVMLRIGKALRQAAKECEAWDQRAAIRDDADFILNVWRQLREKYDCPTDHARLAATAGLMHQAIVGRPTLTLEPPEAVHASR